ncbi:MAG: hypothetical protein Hyperionvirus2_143 [Hyperionvirus sp.]|uniref:Uncharacterized protein n=1 Tax=Hyperionvirus sp. TaxID=2487770 RepID=A0A3G5A6A0_9VIRU|nr:MAG: hypothetical protein Hyperionvirus2_143 [Hyperionvirus sp.]
MASLRLRSRQEADSSNKYFFGGDSFIETSRSTIFDY